MIEIVEVKENQALTSLEVAEMVGKEHSKLIRDIRRYIKQLGEAKIGFSDFFTESTYVSEQNKVMPCYNISKKGCEFIAHKMTGAKGIEFTARYINRFHEMEEALYPRNSSQLSAIAQEQVERLNSTIETILERLDSIESERLLTKEESGELSAIVKGRVKEVMGGKDSEAYQNKELQKEVFQDAYLSLRRNLGVRRFGMIKKNQLSLAKICAEEYQPAEYLQREIDSINEE